MIVTLKAPKRPTRAMPEAAGGGVTGVLSGVVGEDLLTTLEVELDQCCGHGNGEKCPNVAIPLKFLGFYPASRIYHSLQQHPKWSIQVDRFRFLWQIFGVSTKFT